MKKLISFAMPYQVEWKRIVLIYIFQLLSYAVHAIHVQLIAPSYIKQHSAATLICNHSVEESNLQKVEFIRDDNKIFQYIKGRKQPYIISPVSGIELEYMPDGNSIKLKDIGFEASGQYSCEVSTVTPIYTKASHDVDMQVIVPQSEDPLITFKKDLYNVGEHLEANCSSSPARPTPHLTWFINGKEVDVALITSYPQRYHPGHLKSATAQLSVKVSELHAGDNGRLEISCHSTIPDYPIHRHYADMKSRTVSVKIIPVPVVASLGRSLWQDMTPAMFLICGIFHIIYPSMNVQYRI